MTVVHPGEIWLADLDPTIGHEQGGRRPAVVVSSAGFNTLPIDMVMVVPLTGQDRGLVTQPRIDSPGTGLRKASFARPEDLRSIDTTRLARRLGQTNTTEITAIRTVLRHFLDL